MNDIQIMTILADISFLTTLQQARAEGDALTMEFIKAGPVGNFDEDIVEYHLADFNHISNEFINTTLSKLITGLLTQPNKGNTRLEEDDPYRTANGGLPRVYDLDHAWVAFHADSSLADKYLDFLPNAIHRDNQRMSRRYALQSPASLDLPSYGDNESRVA